jgi:hypothetical protein
VSGKDLHPNITEKSALESNIETIIDNNIVKSVHKIGSSVG